ncbi:hypothetical protein [Paenibacillus glycinis]|uniref:Uncharacterized protein n=1 Tax=Paenibacillus glycinis TaxID=2697035 RepID=A0ABW9Y0D9_9BACL|nr:hypothetical protein [Paenibacillus glycinis]NBD27944.1 hypothetical protein [Paenibacillus glycinis]
MKDNQQATGTDTRIPTQAEKISYWTSLLPRIGVGLMIIGIIMSAAFAYNFKDTNLGLMVGFGFIIGGIQVMLLGSLFHALQPKFVKPQEPAANQQLDHIRT